MLRPATPLTVLLLAAFVLLLISVISTPIVKSIPLASFSGVDYGVFGYCDGSTCSKIEIGYNIAKSFTTTQTGTFDLPTSTRTTLSAILIVHPVAAFFTLIMLILAGTAHFHSPSHSPRYLLGLFILSILTLILALLAFLVDVLLFIPHMAFGSYIVLAATILIAISGVVSCAMRRTLVSRKARKRRIEENAEMNGENFYNRQNNTAPIPPVATGALGSGGQGVDKLPSFATFEMQKSEADQTSDERIPLTTRTTNESVPNSIPGSRPGYGNQSPPRDQYGNPIPMPPGSQGMRNRDPSSDPSLNRQYSDMGGRGRGMPYRGRGGYPPGRGGFGPPRGGYRAGYGNPRGGYGPPGPYRPPMNDGMMAGALGGMAAGGMMRGGRGGPPPGYGRGGYDRSLSPGGTYNQYGRRPPGPEGDMYGRNASPRPPPVGEYTAYNPEEIRDSLPRAESPPPLPGGEREGAVGQAVEMDATTGSPSHAPSSFGQFGPLRDSDGDITGMVGLQQQRQNLPINRDTLTTDGSVYSGEESYVPPRQGWTGAGASQLNPAAQAAELPPRSPSGNKRASADNYYEDVDPRFAEPPTAGTPPADHQKANVQPLALGGLDGKGAYEDMQPGSRSPAGSERSEFTSVSQRGVNPNWNSGQPGYGQPMPNRRGGTPQQRPDVLATNPDFEIPGSRGPGKGRAPGQIGGAGMVPSSAYDGAV